MYPFFLRIAKALKGALMRKFQLIATYAYIVSFSFILELKVIKLLPPYQHSSTKLLTNSHLRKATSKKNDCVKSRDFRLHLKEDKNSKIFTV